MSTKTDLVAERSMTVEMRTGPPTDVWRQRKDRTIRAPLAPLMTSFSRSGMTDTIADLLHVAKGTVQAIFNLHEQCQRVHGDVSFSSIMWYYRTRGPGPREAVGVLSDLDIPRGRYDPVPCEDTASKAGASKRQVVNALPQAELD